MSLTSSLEVTVDADVRFVFRVRNEGADVVELHFSTGQRADVAVFEDGVEAWRWSDGRMFIQVLGQETISPGETVEHEFRWPDPPGGAYTAVASLTADREVEARKEFSV